MLFAMKLFVSAILLALSACMKPVPPSAFASTAPEMRPERFFDGESRGNGVIQSASGKPAKHFTVLSRGKLLPDGRFQLYQDITQATPGTLPAKTSSRTWIMSRTGSNSYSATLSDAAGSVTGDVHGNLFHLRYLMKKPFVTMEQWLYLQPDGRTVLNEGIVKMPGRTIARLSEIIVRSDGN
jgi:Protein of unknown function (DUF3833)